MAKILDPVLPILSGYGAIMLVSFGGPGNQIIPGLVV